MNIIWIYDKPINPESGGTERATHLIMQGLANRGYKCLGVLIFDQTDREIITSDGVRITNLLKFLLEKKVNIVINQIAYDSWLIKEFLAKGGDDWRLQGGKIVSFMHFNPKYPVISFSSLCLNWSRLSFFRKIKRILRITLLPYQFFRHEMSRKKSYKYVYENSNIYILLSNSFFKSFIKIARLKDLSKLVSIPNPLTFKESYPLEMIEKKEKILLVVSRLNEPQKRISIILKAWELLSEFCIFHGWSLIIVGDGEWSDFYKSIVKKNNLKNITFEGQQPPQEYYNRSSIFLMTSSTNFEGWGLTLTESMQCGVVPIVMESSSVFHDIIRNYVNGFITPNNNLIFFCSVIKNLIINNELRNQVAKNAIIDSSIFNLEAVIDEWELKILLNLKKFIK